MRWLCLIPAFLITVIGIGVIFPDVRSAEIERARLRINLRHLRAISRYVWQFNRVHGRYPSNNEGLMGVRELVDACARRGQRDPDLSHCYLMKSGIISLWGDPFIYENRHGLHDTLLDSPVERDAEGNWSISLGGTVHIWSVGAEKAYNDYRAKERRRLILGLLFGSALVLCLALYALLTYHTVPREGSRASRASRFAWFLVLDTVIVGIAALLLYLPSLGPRESCYVIAYGTRRTPQLTKEYIAALRTYRSKGVISEKAYRRMVEAANNDGPIE